VTASKTSDAGTKIATRRNAACSSDKRAERNAACRNRAANCPTTTAVMRKTTSATRLHELVIERMERRNEHVRVG
jgi:hypothetical protein